MSERDCGAVNGRFVCNRQPGHDWCHEERAENGGAIGWVPEPPAPAERERIAREAAAKIAELDQQSWSFVNSVEAIVRAALDAAARGGE